jgi:hypothetical protein
MLTVNVYNLDNKVYSRAFSIEPWTIFKGHKDLWESNQSKGQEIGLEIVPFFSSIGLPLPSILGMVSEFAKD